MFFIVKETFDAVVEKNGIYLSTRGGIYLSTIAPSKSTEAWVMKALFPNDKEARKRNWECYQMPAKRLGLLPLKERIVKSERSYENKKHEMESRWPAIVHELTEAKRFQEEFLREVQ